MKSKIKVIVLLFLINLIFTNPVKAWHSFSLPRVVAGGGAGFFRASLDNINNLYTSKWDGIYTGHANFRLYRLTYLTLQYAKYKNENGKQQNDISGNPIWEETFYNVGVRWYSESFRKWNFYTTLGMTFTKIQEQPGLSVFPNSNENSDSKNGRGFFLEIGADYTIFPHAALFWEIEISSVGEGGVPAIVGHSLGGFAFQAGLNFYF
jgi:hypothetical protein